jgi:quercetin dioxygenase-like cupin family protein
VQVRAVTGDALQVISTDYPPNTEFPIHRHPEEQIVVVMAGRLRFSLDGVQYDLEPGHVVCIPSNVPHGASSLDERTSLIAAYTPPRRDYLPGTAAP